MILLTWLGRRWILSSCFSITKLWDITNSRIIHCSSELLTYTVCQKNLPVVALCRLLTYTMSQKNLPLHFCLQLSHFVSFLADRCNATFGYCHNMSSVVCLSVARVYCDKTAAVRIMQFALKCSPMPELLSAKFDDKIWKGLLDLGAKVRWGGFRLHDAVSRKQCEVVYGLSIATKVDDLERGRNGRLLSVRPDVVL